MTQNRRCDDLDVLLINVKCYVLPLVFIVDLSVLLAHAMRISQLLAIICYVYNQIECTYQYVTTQ